MQSVEYGRWPVSRRAYDQALPRVVEALKVEGFGIITEIDVKKTMKEKLDVDVPPHTILGACNPKLAHAALEVERTWASFCRATSSSTPPGRHARHGRQRGAMLGMVGNEALQPIASQVQERLDRVLASL